MVSLLCWIALLSTAIAAVHGGNVTYDGRSLIIDGQRRIIFSGSIHYPRSTPEMWPSLISKAKRGGLDAIDTYVFWNLHEPEQEQFDFSGRKDIIRFLREIQAQGLYVCLRIGPFIESEWNYGGFPFWLHDIPGIVFRSDNEPFKYHMQAFVTKIVNMMKSEKLYASQGGPIILSQIENEYQMVESAFHKQGPPYVRWAAAMAVGLQTGVPWVMCKQNDAPDPVINACNGMRCGETFVGPNSPHKPAIWTENWTSFYQVYGEEPYIRSPEHIAFHVALFIAKKGSFVNYYMYHGGTNFGRTSSAFVLTGYYDQAPLDEYGLLRQPKYGHLKELHATIKSFSKVLLHGAYSNFSLGPSQQAYVYQEESGKCAAFLVNKDSGRQVKVVFQNISHKLPPKSISILPDCKTIAFNTAKVTTQHSARSMKVRKMLNSIEQWEEYKEPIPNLQDANVTADVLLEHMNTTKDKSDYLWYTLRVKHNSTNAASVLNASSTGHVLHAFVNGDYAGFAHGTLRHTSFTLEKAVNLRNGTNNIALLSAMVGLPASGAYLERRVAGLRRVTVDNKEFVNDIWGYQVGLLGEKFQIYTDHGSNKVQWNRFGSSTHQPLTWYKTLFDAPQGNNPVALNLLSMGKGEAWVNGQSIGRYWVSLRTSAGNPSQTWYNIPRSFLKQTNNQLVILEEQNGYPPGITVDTVTITKVCGNVPELHFATVQLSCPSRKNISKILFASYGLPSGNCMSYATGDCHSSKSKAIVEKACIGKRKCTVTATNEFFSDDPCIGIPKTLLVDAKCT